MAMTAWSANVSRSAICLSENGWGSARRITMTPSGVPSRSSGVARDGSVPCKLCLERATVSGNSGLGNVAQVLDVDRPPVRYSPASYRVATDGDGVVDRP